MQLCLSVLSFIVVSQGEENGSAAETDVQKGEAVSITLIVLASKIDDEE